MHVGLVVPRLGFAGGIEKYARDVSTALSDRGHDLRLIHGPLAGRDPELYALPFRDVVPLGAGCARGLEVAYVQRASRVSELAALGDLPVAIASHDHDHTCVRSHRYLPMSLEPCHRPPGPPCVLHGCCLIRDRRPETPLPVRIVSPFALRRRLLELADRGPLVACSRYLANSLVLAGVSPNRVHAIHPIPPEDPTPRTLRPVAPILAFVGQLVRGKGVDIAIKALELVPDAKLVVAGDGPSRVELERLAHRSARGRVEFLGYVPPDDLSGVYDRASVVVIPSRWPEPFGMVGIEAMRRARPVAAAVRRLLDQRDSGERALRHVELTFPHARLVDRIEGLLQSLA